MIQTGNSVNPAFVQSIRNAIASNEFEIYYQPVFNLETGAVDAFEALLRWNSSSGFRTPGSFLPEAIDCGIIDEIGHWVTGQVCRDLVMWNNAGRNVPSVSVNYSDIELRQPSFVMDLVQTISSYGLEMNSIMLEFSELSLASDIAFFTTRMKELQEYGFMVSIDNFGRHFTSISLLREVTANCIKIDGSFLDSARTNERGYTIVQGIVALIRALDINIIAERIENEFNLDMARSLGFNMVQGYYFSTPLKAVDAEMYIV